MKVLKLTKNQKEKLNKATKTEVKRRIVNHHYVNVVYADGKVVSKSKWTMKNKKSTIEGFLKIAKREEDVKDVSTTAEHYQVVYTIERKPVPEDEEDEDDESENAMLTIRLISKTDFRQLSDRRAEELVKDYVKQKLSQRTWDKVKAFEKTFLRRGGVKGINNGTSIDDNTGIAVAISWGQGESYEDSKDFSI